MRKRHEGDVRKSNNVSISAHRRCPAGGARKVDDADMAESYL